MAQELNGKKILVLVSNGVDETVMSNVQRDMIKSGALIKTVGTESGLVNSWKNNTWGLYFPVDMPISQVLGVDYDMLIVPSGSRSVQKLANNPHAERIISSFIASQKPMCFMGDAVELLAKTGHAKGWSVSAPEVCQPVMVDAGATWVEDTDEYIDRNLMTGICTGDICAFVQRMVEHFVNAENQPEKIAA
jgi:protease I